MALNTKGTNVEYDKFEIKQTKKASSDKKYEDDSQKAPTEPAVLKNAQVENIKVMEDVL